MISNNTEN